MEAAKGALKAEADTRPRLKFGHIRGVISCLYVKKRDSVTVFVLYTQGRQYKYTGYKLSSQPLRNQSTNNVVGLLGTGC